MEMMFENFCLMTDDTFESDRPFMVACKDRQITSEERWVLASLSNDDMKQVYEYLSGYFQK